MLSMQDVRICYGGVAAVREVSLSTAGHQVVTIIGSNGAGKTTLLRAVSGLHRLRSGRIMFDGEAIEALPPEEIVARGIAHVPEGRRVFPELTVDENLRLGAYLRRDAAAVRTALAEVYALFPRLAERRRQHAKTMSGGEQQMVAIGRALMSAPRLLLLDEPSIGLSPIMVQEIAGIITNLRSKGVNIILVEQNAEMALQLSDYGYVLETGAVTLSGSGIMLRGNADVRKAYLGG